MNLIGNKNDFAIEYRITDIHKMLGYGKIWIQDKFYGTNYDLIYLKGYLLQLIEDILDAKPISFLVDHSNSDSIYENLELVSNETSDYQIVSSTFTDDFIGYKFREEQDIVLVWKLRDDVEMIFDDLKEYTKSTIIVKVNLQIIEEVMNKYKFELKKARA